MRRSTVPARSPSRACLAGGTWAQFRMQPLYAPLDSRSVPSSRSEPRVLAPAVSCMPSAGACPPPALLNNDCLLDDRELDIVHDGERDSLT